MAEGARASGEGTGPVCARCPKVLGRSCCEVGQGEQLATLTRADVERVAAHTGLGPSRFSEVEWLTEEEAQDYESRRPLYRGYFRRGPARLTLRRKGEACVFHRPGSGCVLPAGVRPTACLLYPFELWPDGTWSLQVDRLGELTAARAAAGEACLAVEEAGTLEDVLGAFGTHPEGLEALGQRLRAEVHQHARAGGRS